MPNPHFDVQIISRGSGSSAVGAASYRSGTKLTSRQGGKSAIAAAAYRAGEPLYDEAQQKTYDYTRKEDVVHKEIMLPEKAPGALKNRETLWNTIEQIEKRKDAQLARDIIASLPRELSLDQQIALVREFVRTNFTSKGMIADIALHEKQASDGDSQPHVHILLTMREITSEGFGKKNREWNHRDRLKEWRDAWEKHTNRHLEKAGREERVSLKSYKERGIDKTPQQYLGYAATQMEKRGKETKRGRYNRRVKDKNKLRDRFRKHPGTENQFLPRGKALPATDTLQGVARQLQDSDGESGNDRSKPKDEQQVMAFSTYRDQHTIRERFQYLAEKKPTLGQKMRRSRQEHLKRQSTRHYTRFANLRNNQEAADAIKRQQEKEQEQEYER